MAFAAFAALVHDMLVTIGIYALSGFQVSPDTVIAFLTVLGYSLYDTIVVFDRVGENTKALVNKGRLSYADSVNLSLNQVFMRSVNTSLVAIIPVLSILVLGAYVLGATTLRDFGLALFVGLTTGAYSSIGIASPLLAIFKEREPKYADLKARLAKVGTSGLLTPRAAAMAGDGGASVSSNTVAGGTQTPRPRPAPRKVSSKRKPTTTRRS
ncbi:MAG: protein translocase subunit SecF, partial [Nitrososphaerota archaeon]|nr:protein translocase subunit SecF [Nitrososphaerota archaeon]